jgi:hypothetical protein
MITIKPVNVWIDRKNTNIVSQYLSNICDFIQVFKEELKTCDSREAFIIKKLIDEEQHKYCGVLEEELCLKKDLQIMQSIYKYYITHRRQINDIDDFVTGLITTFLTPLVDMIRNQSSRFIIDE